MGENGGRFLLFLEEVGGSYIEENVNDAWCAYRGRLTQKKEKFIR